MIVTKIERQKRHPERVNIYLDGEFALGLNRDVVIKLRLRKGDILSREQIQKISEDEEFNSAKLKAIRLLNHRLRSEKEIRLKLSEKNFSKPSIEKAIMHLRSIGFIDDFKFATAFIHDVLLHKPSGQKLLQQKLRLKGISAEIIQTAIEQNTSNDQEQQAAYNLAMKLIKRFRKSVKMTDKLKQQKRISDSLLRNGFNRTTISNVLKKFFGNKSVNILEE